MSVKICKYCGIEYNPRRGYRYGMCGNCSCKSVLLPKFIKARDDLREQLGLERLGATNEKR
jgi:hypothetical protein